MTDKHPLRQVLLLHDLPHEPSHYDWMLELPIDREHRLITFRTRRRIDALARAELDLPRLPDHRARYLDYEGPIDNERGSVRRIAAGSVFHIRSDPNTLDAIVAWRGLPPLTVTAHRSTHDRWRIRIRPHDPQRPKGFP